MPVPVAPLSREPIAVRLLIDSAGVVGATLRYDVGRVTSGGVFQLLDFADATFRAPASVVTRYRTLDPEDATYAQGVYADATGGLDLSTFTNPEQGTALRPVVYTVTIYQTAPTSRILDADDLVVGLETAAFEALYNRRALSEAGLYTQYRADASTPAYTATVTDKTGGPITLSDGEAARTTALVSV